jgi:hypothetical protein
MLPALGLDEFLFFFVLPIGAFAGLRWWRRRPPSRVLDP